MKKKNSKNEKKDSKNEKKDSKKSLAPYIFFGGFILFLSIDITLISYAISTYGGTEIKNSYIKGSKYNEIIKHKNYNKSLNWDVFMTAIEDNKSFMINVIPNDTKKKFIKNAKIYVSVKRPTHNNETYNLELNEKNNYYAKKLNLFRSNTSKGQWIFKIKIKKNNHVYTVIKRKIF